MNLDTLRNEAVVLFDMWGIGHWEFKLDKAPRRLGLCNYRDKVISIGEYHATHDSAEQVLDTLKHEIAHAVAYLRGECDGHGPKWKAIAKLVGCSPTACNATAEGVKLSVKPGKWIASCPNCDYVVQYYRKPKAAKQERYHVNCGSAKPMQVKENK